MSMANTRRAILVHLLLAKHRMTAAELAKEMEVSVRTVYRDLKVLSADGLLLITASGKGGGISVAD